MYSERDWNYWAVEDVENNGKKASAMSKYCASKTLAERTAWRFVEQHQPHFDLVSLLPTFVFGPVIHEVRFLYVPLHFLTANIRLRPSRTWAGHPKCS